MLRITFRNNRRRCVPQPDTVQNAETIEQPPPKEHSFMEGDVFLLVKDNDVIMCCSGAREGVAKIYLEEMLKAVGTDDVFGLEQIANLDKVDLVKNEGVKAIRMGSSLYKASMDRMDRLEHKTKRQNLMGALAAEFLRLFGEDDLTDPVAMQKYENLNVKVEISFDTRKTGGDVAAEAISGIGRSIVADPEDGFVIVTREGKTLTANDIKVSQKVNLVPHGKSVACESAWREMENYYAELETSGVLVL